MRSKNYSARFAEALVKTSQRFEKYGAVKTAMWLEKRAEYFDKNIAISNFAKRF